MNKKVIIGSVLGVLLIAGLLWWAVAESNKPLPGQSIPDLGRDHITDISDVEYNSNPPTSGKHFPVWAKPGVYDRVISDGYLIHSLEHGYIVISYDCTKLNSKLKTPASTAKRGEQNSKLIEQAFAHEGEVDTPASSSSSAAPLMHMNKTQSGAMSALTPSDPPAEEVKLPDSFKSSSCKDLVSKLSEFTKEAQRIIIVPRPKLDGPIALTAWGRLLKLEKVDEIKIKEFIRSFHNKGPEATVE